MTANDLHYNKLLNQTLNQKPYRGTHNRFPIDKRSQSNKYFLVDEENGEKIFRVHYGNYTKYSEVSKEEYEHHRGKINSQVMAQGNPDSPTYYMVEYLPHQVGIVRPDNTFEFTAHRLQQGINTILSNWSYGVYYQSSRHGGVVYRSQHAFHPIWKGARFEMPMMKAHTPYQVFGLAVNRKAAKAHFKPYEKFFVVAKTMSTAMEMSGFLNTAKEVVDEHIKYDWDNHSFYWYNPERDDMFKKAARAAQDTSPLDAYILYLCAYKPQILNLMNKKITTWGGNDYSLAGLYQSFHRSLTQEVYRTTPELLKYVEYEAGKQYPANNWGIKVVVDGKQVQQY